MTPVFEVSGQREEDGSYCLWSPVPELRVYMHLDAINGITRDLLESEEGSGSGLLLGRETTEEGEAIWVTRYARELQTEENPPEKAECRVVGAYLFTTTLDAIDAPAQAEIRFVLALRRAGAYPKARFFARQESGAFAPAGTIFPFRGSVMPAETNQQEFPGAGRGPRVVPDFPGMPANPAALPPLPEAVAANPVIETGSHRWAVFAAVAVVAIGAAAWVLGGGRRSPAPPPAEVSNNVPPLGLFADPAGNDLQLYWNTGAAILHGARAARLFVRDGEEQSTVDLQYADLAQGMWQYHPKTHDVTFRMEVTGQDGRLDAESFRFQRSVAAVASPNTPLPATPAAFVPARPLRKVAPVVPEGVRPRIRQPFPVDIRVMVDDSGRVVAATPITRSHTSVESLLISSALRASRQWRFHPATRGGKPTAANEVLHFEFQR
jgi:hypothetical protein